MFTVLPVDREWVSPYSHPLLFSSTENVHPVLDWVPAALPAQYVSQLNIVQVLLQHLDTYRQL